ncbi:MAG: aspartate aminotransferase family protein [Holophagales bacterium]|nr:aspartate aminotransferase family protein [Holophagales bacterium]
MRTAVPGPESLIWSHRIARVEAPGINTLYGGGPNILWQEALGANVLDVDGNIYLDLTSGFGVAAIGHRHPAVIRAVREQGELLVHALGDAIGHTLRVRLAEELRRLAPIERAQVYFAVSGADAVEIAVKTALLHHQRAGRGERRDLIVFEPSYHGLTQGALNLGSRPEFRAPFEAHLHSHVRRLPFGCDPRTLESCFSTPGQAPPAAVVVEPIVGREGVLLPPTGWLRHLFDSCRRTGTLLIVDEIFTGFGRTGSLFATEAEGIVPDLICCGKALGGGLPIAAVLGSAALMAVWEVPGEALHTATFVAHPLACAAALATLDVIESDRLVCRAAELGQLLRRNLADWTDRFAPEVIDVRGRGAMWGIELRSRERAAHLVRLAWARGILLLAGGPDGRVAQIVPPLTISEEQLSHALSSLASLLHEISESGPSRRAEPSSRPMYGAPRRSKHRRR